MIETAPEIRGLREAFASLALRAEVRTDCPEPDRLWRAVRGELPTAEVRDLVDHTVSCPGCAEDWRLARKMATGDGASVDRSSAAKASGRRAWYLTAAAVLAVVVGAGLWQTPRGRQPPAEFRALAESSMRSLTPEEIPLPRGETLLRWAIDGEFDSFTVRVATDDLETVSLARGLKSAEFKVPVQDLDRIPDGARLLWQVEALLPGGERVVSPTFVNRLE